MIKIRHYWGDILRSLEIVPRGAREDYGHLVDYSGIDKLQDGSLSYEEYVAGLGNYLGGVSVEDAARIHAHILWEEYPESLAIVKSLKGLGLNVGCLSNTNEPHIRECFESGRFPVCSAFDRLVTSYELGLNKPDLAIYREYERVMGIEGLRVVFFDDSVANVEAAREVGWTGFVVDPAGDVGGQIRAGLGSVGVVV